MHTSTRNEIQSSDEFADSMRKDSIPSGKIGISEQKWNIIHSERVELYYDARHQRQSKMLEELLY